MLSLMIAGVLFTLYLLKKYSYSPIMKGFITSFHQTKKDKIYDNVCVNCGINHNKHHNFKI